MIDAIAPIERIVSGPAIDRAIALAVVQVDRVVATFAVDLARGAVAIPEPVWIQVDFIVTRSGAHDIITLRQIDGVVAAEIDDDVLARGVIDDIVASPPDNRRQLAVAFWPQFRRPGGGPSLCRRRDRQ